MKSIGGRFKDLGNLVEIQLSNNQIHSILWRWITLLKVLWSNLVTVYRCVWYVSTTFLHVFAWCRIGLIDCIPRQNRSDSIPVPTAIRLWYIMSCLVLTCKNIQSTSCIFFIVIWNELMFFWVVLRNPYEPIRISWYGCGNIWTKIHEQWKTPWLFRGLSYPLLEGVYPITHGIHVWYVYLHLSHKVQPDVGKYTSSMDPSWVIGIPESLFSTASSTWKPCCPRCARLFLSKKRGFPRYGVWKPRAAWMEPNLMLLEMWAVMNKNTPKKLTWVYAGWTFTQMMWGL